MSEHYSVTSVDELLRERTGAKAALSALVATSAVFLAILFFSREGEFPRGLFLCGIAALFTLTLLMRSMLRAICRKRRVWGKPTKILIVGADIFAQQSAECLQRLSLAPCQIAGYVALPGQVAAPQASPLYRLDQIAGLNAANGFEEAIIAIHPLEFSRVPEVVEALEKLCLPARAIVDLGEGVTARQKMVQLGRLQVLDLTSTPADLLHYAVLKRAFDIAFSALVLLLAAPLFGLIAVLIKLTSPGPVFFTQERIGLNGTNISACISSGPCTSRREAVKAIRYLDNIANDPRRTRLGELLAAHQHGRACRSSSMFIKGEMSVVGPRPERPYFRGQVPGEKCGATIIATRLKVGITGWAQVLRVAR
jgi:lipopolysaccharide/colanic/teichoic acid biosynthesis glycosyltransferase